MSSAGNRYTFLHFSNYIFGHSAFFPTKSDSLDVHAIRGSDDRREEIKNPTPEHRVLRCVKTRLRSEANGRGKREFPWVGIHETGEDLLALVAGEKRVGGHREIRIAGIARWARPAPDRITIIQQVGDVQLKPVIVLPEPAGIAGTGGDVGFPIRRNPEVIVSCLGILHGRGSDV